MTARTLNEAYEVARALDAPLADRLAAFAQSLRILNQPMAEAVDRLVLRLKSARIARNAPAVGAAMPPFLLPDHTGQLVSLGSLLEKGPVAVSFARGHWCPYCRLAICALADIAEPVHDMGAQLVAIVPDRQEFTSSLRAEAKATYPILTDVDNAYAMSLELAFWVGDEMEHHMRRRDVDLEVTQGNNSWFVPVPAVFVIGMDGVVSARYVDPDYRKRMAVDELMDALRRAPRLV